MPVSNAVIGVAAAARRAAARIEGIVRETPLVRSTALSDATGAEVFLKLENLQHTGSFKLRGASNRLLTLTPDQRAAGCVAASSGNHGAGLAYAMRELGVGGVIFVPEQTSATKLAAIRALGADVRHYGTDGLDTEQHARRYAADHGMFYVSPYNDAEVIAGQGTCGVELVRQLPDVDVAFVAVGGGGLLSGIGSVLRAHNEHVRLVACQPEASAVMSESVAAGRVLDLPSKPTLSDGTAGGVEADSITFAYCCELADEFVLVSEAEIANAMRRYHAAHDDVIEGAAGVAIAALLKKNAAVQGLRVAVIICGGNISPETLAAVMQQDDRGPADP